MRYLVWGYYGYGNLGDDLMLMALRDGIQRRDPGAKIIVRCRTVPPVEGIEAFPVEAARPAVGFARRVAQYLIGYAGRIVSCLSRVDVFVIGGGTLFLDKGRFNRSLVELAFFSVAARLLGRRVVLVGVGMDDLGHPASLLAIRTILVCAHGAWFRETYGYETARRMVRDPRRIHRSADLAYALKWPIAGLLPRTRIGLALADYHAYFGEAANPARAQLLDVLRVFVAGVQEATGLEPIFLVFQPGEGFRGDVLVRELLRDLGPEGQREPVIVPVDPGTITELYASLACVVGMHYHALVLSAIHRVPFVAIGHERKFEDISEQYGTLCLSMDSLNAGELLVAVARALASEAPADAVRAAEQERAEANFEWMGAGH